MESLVASYASSSSDDEGDDSIKLPPPSKPKSSVFSSLPPPKSNLPPYKHNPKPSSSSSQPNPKPSSSSLFSALPNPKSQNQHPPPQIPKNIVQFRPPINPITPHEDDDDDDVFDNDKHKKTSESLNSIKDSSFKSLSSLIPAPRNSMSLGGSSSSSGTARRSTLQADEPTNYHTATATATAAATATCNALPPPPSNDCANYDATYGPSYNDASNLAPPPDNYENYAATYDVTYPGYQTNFDQQYENNWIDKSDTTAQTTPTMPVEFMGRKSGKRGRNDSPAEMIEVKQDELMKNRPREDTAKLTGIAFGPSYQVLFSLSFCFFIKFSCCFRIQPQNML